MNYERGATYNKFLYEQRHLSADDSRIRRCSPIAIHAPFAPVDPDEVAVLVLEEMISENLKMFVFSVLNSIPFSYWGSVIYAKNDLK